MVKYIIEVTRNNPSPVRMLIRSALTENAKQFDLIALSADDKKVEFESWEPVLIDGLAALPKQPGPNQWECSKYRVPADEAQIIAPE